MIAGLDIHFIGVFRLKSVRLSLAFVLVRVLAVIRDDENILFLVGE